MEESKNPKKSFIKNYVLPKAMFFTIGMPKGSFGSIDITNRCQLRCKHCYFFEQDNPVEFTNEQWLEKIERITKGPNPVRSMTWVGGEPLLRKDLIEKGRKFFSHNMIVTNGLAPLPNWPDVSFHVSLDGNEAAHEKQRNQTNIYKRIMRNVSRPDLDVTIAYCISSINIHCVEEVLEEWKDTGIKGFLFSFYTPIESIQDPLFPGWKERDQILDRIIELKKTKYGEYICNELRTLELMKSENSKKVTDSCLFLSKGVSLDPVGNKKEKCMMGDKADCDRCGCIVPFYLHYKTERKQIVSEIFEDLTSYLSSKARHLFASSQNTSA